MNNSNIINQSPFLRGSREFPEDPILLTQEVNKCYVDIANSVNGRTISLFPTNKAAHTGEVWFTTNSITQRGFRQVYTFTNLVSGATLQIAHGLNLTFLNTLTTIKGIGFVQATQRYLPLPYVSSAMVSSQIEVFVDSTNINIISGATAQSPITTGFILLEWISNG